jgi:hypothetical protein
MSLLESHLLEQSNLSIFTVLQHRDDVDFNLENLSRSLYGTLWRRPINEREIEEKT